MNHLALAVGLGLVTSLLMSEVWGLATGGLVVPGYVALLVTEPLQLVLLLLAALLTWGTVEAIASITILFGKRRTTLTLLLGYLFHMGLRQALLQLPPAALGELPLTGEVGLIVPGLLALWLSRQGCLQTFSALICASAVVRLLLILCLGDAVAA